MTLHEFTSWESFDDKIYLNITDNSSEKHYKGIRITDIYEIFNVADGHDLKIVDVCWENYKLECGLYLSIPHLYLGRV